MIGRNRLDRGKAKPSITQGHSEAHALKKEAHWETVLVCAEGRQALSRKYEGSVSKARLGMVVFSRENKSKQQFPFQTWT